MKGTDAIVAEALKELSHAYAAYMAMIRAGSLDDPELEAERSAASERHYAAKERVQKLADVLYPAPPHAPKKRPKPRTATGIARAANDSTSRAPRQLPAPRMLPAPQVEVTIIPDAKPAAPRQMLLASEVKGGG